MTREEAVEILKGAIKKPNTTDGYLGQALDMAIKALEQEPCEDCISRQAVLDAMSHNWKHICFVSRRKQPTKGEKAVYLDMREMVRQMPSVTPQQKTGKWIDCSDEGYVECPFCGHATTCEDNIDELHYCFYCGARMEAESEDRE